MAATGGLEQELEGLRDERDDLELRVRFLEQQLTKAMAERVRTVPVDHVHVQTEPEMGDMVRGGVSRRHSHFTHVQHMINYHYSRRTVYDSSTSAYAIKSIIERKKRKE